MYANSLKYFWGILINWERKSNFKGDNSRDMIICADRRYPFKILLTVLVEYNFISIVTFFLFNSHDKLLGRIKLFICISYPGFDILVINYKKL